MASSMLRLLRRSMAVMGASGVKGSYTSNSYAVAYLSKSPASGCPCSVECYSNASAYHGNEGEERERRKVGRKGAEEKVEGIPTEGISKPMSEVLKQLNKKVPGSFISILSENGCPIKYVPWHVVNRIMNLHAPEWSGEVSNITYSPDGKSVCVIYRVTLYGTDAEDLFQWLSLLCAIFRESTGTASVEDKGYGDAVQKAEAMAFRQACAQFGLGLHLYREDVLNKFSLREYNWLPSILKHVWLPSIGCSF